MTVTLTVDHNTVNAQIAQTTGYAGAKRSDTDQGAYARVSTTDGDDLMLERFWAECRDNLCAALRRQVVSEGLEGDTYRIDLSLSQSFDTALQSNLSDSLTNYFVNYITGRWMALAGGPDADAYSRAATETLSQIERKCMHKRAPRRPVFHR